MDTVWERSHRTVTAIDIQLMSARADRPGPSREVRSGGSTKTALRLVAGTVEVVSRSSELVRQARLLAAARASSGAEALPAERFDALWEAERLFIEVARAELGLPSAFAPRPVNARP